MTAQTDPLAIYRIPKQGIPSSFKAPDPFEEQESQDSLDQYRIKPPEKTEYTLKDIPRIGVGHVARGLETVVGAPEEYKRGLGTLLDLTIGVPAEYLSGKKQPKLRQLLKDPLASLGKHREIAEEIERSSTSPGEASIFTQYPTSEDIKEKLTKPISKELTGSENYLEPQNEQEKFGQEFTQDLVRLAIPGSGISSWSQRVGLALAGNTAKETAKQLGYSPSTQELVKMGTLGIVSLAQLGNAPQFAREYFQRTKTAMPRGVRMNTMPLENALNAIRNTQWYRGHATPSTIAARQMIDSIEQRIQRGSMSVQDAMTLRESINELASNLGAFSVEGTHRTAHVARLNEVRDALLQGMEQTVGRQYPNWWHQYQDANAVFGITQRSSAMGDFIARNYGKPVFSDAGKILFGNALAKGAAGVAKLGIAGAGLVTGSKLVSLTNRIARSPTLRRYYGEVVSAATAGDSLAMANALNKFDEFALREEKQEKAIRPLRRPSQK